MKKVFVDGLTGTTGLKIHERLSLYSEIELIEIEYEKRRDPKERARCLNEADIVFLCLPDDAAREAVELVTNPNTKIIDASTAHRTDKNWTYGIPELSKEHKEAIKNSKRVSNPGCHSTAFILSLYPLVNQGIMPRDYPVSFQSLTGYSGGGKSLIEKYEANMGKNEYTKAARPYSLSLNHKHLPEMTIHTGLSKNPVFIPVLSNVYQGLATIIPIHMDLLTKPLEPKAIHDLLSDYYSEEKFVKVMPYKDESYLFDGGFDITGCNNTNRAEIFVFGNEEKGSAAIITRLDNLGKGASGAAIQNMNLMLGLEEDLHLQ
ncbi:MAG TPA: N-acetyl-gamma-glutamyl-phosphate reductase [Clostridiales bacterium]|jgi:N-acetyl-gamma-glutamyl-phosphate reductase|nr:N-acetyl-gamma-glutamyl-phosphate reductase [Clostridiales bacterium]